MSDFNSSLPVRTESAGDLAVKVVDATVTSQGLAVDSSGRTTTKIEDAAGNALTSQTSGAQRALDVGINVSGSQVDPRSIRALTATDIVTAAQGTPAAIGSAWTVHPTDGTNSQSYTATGEAKVSFTQALPAGSNLIGAVNLDLASAPISATNPLPVVISAGVSGTIVNNYNTVAAVAANATSNHTYTITSGKAFQGKKIFASSSGMLKIEVQISADGSTFNTVFVAFNSASSPVIDIDMHEILFLEAAGSGAAVRIIRTNRDKAAEDVYSTISGVEV